MIGTLILGLIVGFVAGILVGRKNKKKTELIVSDAKSVYNRYTK
jgi:uncharacterized membrane protein YeaQ/YmgE (transglycosylase-associated protein family)